MILFNLEIRNQGSVVRKVHSAIHWIVIFLQLSKHFHYLVNVMLKFIISKLKSLSISCEVNILSVTAFLCPMLA